MMTAAVLSAGDGYKYYTESIATGDMQRAKGTELTDYYTVGGNPPGVWIGDGIGLLGVSGDVSEAQMRALFGEGLHPDADAITAEMSAAGAKEKAIAEAVKLGRGYYKFDVKDSQLRGRIEREAAEFERLNGRKPDRDERREIRMREGAIMFRNVHGRQPLDKEELGKYVTAALKTAQHAVAGYDLTFSMPKSMSLLWAHADRDTARELEQIMEAAIEDTIKYLQEFAVATRAGVNGVRQIDIQGGIIATRFRHHESRTGDVHVHDHVVVANKVKGVDGKWRTLDSKLLLRMKVASSEHFQMRLFDRAEKAGYGSRQRVIAAGKLPQLELAGVTDQLINLHSTRGQSIKKATEQLVKEYAREHGRSPNQATLIKLSAQAWQQTRPTKDKPRSITQLRRDTRNKSLKGVSYHEVELLERHAKKASKVAAKTEQLKPSIDVHDAAREIMRNVETVRGTWGEHHVRAEVTRWVSANRYRRFTITDAGETRSVTRQEAQRFLLRNTLQLDSIRLTPEHVHGRFQPLTRKSDGESFYVSKGRTLYTSTRVLEAEQRLLNAARTVQHRATPVSAAAFDRARRLHPKASPGQVRLACEFVTNPAGLLVGIGPAGAGKTTSIRLAAAAAAEDGRRLIGLAPSKQAAKVFAAEVNAPAYTLDGFLTAHRHARASGKPVHRKYAIAPGDVVVIDEGFMAATTPLDEAVQIIINAGGYARPLGDHAQASAVGAGGAARLIAREVGAIELDQVFRFSDKNEAKASQILRESPENVDPFAWYKTNGRIIAASKERITELVFNDYLADVQAGREAIMGAPTRAYVDELNGRAQAHHLAQGTVTGRRNVPLADGHSAFVGDRIMTRRNDSALTMEDRGHVDNGDLYTVTAVHRDGSLTAAHTKHGGIVHLPTRYVRDHTNLGYAFTAHQEQGDTVGGKNELGQFVEGIARGIITARTARALAYVLATRGVTQNVLYVETEPGQHPDEVLAQVARNVDSNLSANEMIDRETDRILDLGRLVDEHQDVVVQANAIRFATLAKRVLGDTRSGMLTTSAGWEAAAAGLARAEKHGLDVDEVLKTTWTERDFRDAEDIGAVMSWRIENHLEVSVKDGTAAPLPEPGLDTGWYEWAIDRDTARHPDVPENWRDHLTERARYIDDRMTLRGTELALKQPDWTRDLGPVPADPVRHQKWMRLAAEVELFRTKYNIPADEPVAIPERFQEHELGRNLAARITALHKSTAISRARGNTATANPERQLQAVEKQARKVDQQRPVSAAERVKAALDPAREDRLAKQLRALQEKVGRVNEAARRPRADADDPNPTSITDPVPGVTRQRGPRLR